MSEVPVQDACNAVKTAILKLESAVKSAQKLGTFKAKHQVDLLLQPLMVRTARFDLPGVVAIDACFSLMMPVGVGSIPFPTWLQASAFSSHDYGMLRQCFTSSLTRCAPAVGEQHETFATNSRAGNQHRKPRVQ
jgi:hypothetical protein